MDMSDSDALISWFFFDKFQETSTGNYKTRLCSGQGGVILGRGRVGEGVVAKWSDVIFNASAEYVSLRD